MQTILLAEMEFGIMVSALGYLIVISSLTFLFGIYSLLPKIITAFTNYAAKRAGKKECANQNELELTGNEAAAIAAAVNLIINEAHDHESGRITIKKVTKQYSPWNSKIYAMNNYSN